MNVEACEPTSTPASERGAAAPLIAAEAVGKRYRLYRRPADRAVEWLTAGRARRHRAFWAVRGVDLELRPGETLGLIGVNGAGKTTLLRMLAGIVTPTEGSVRVRGRVHALIELRAGFENALTGRQNVRYAGRMLGFSGAYIREREADIVSFAGLGEYIDQPIATYSSGMFARLSFAMMVFLDPDALLIDETLAVGDDAFKRRCFAFLDGFVAREDRAALVVSHSLGQVRRLCRRVAWIHEGRLRAIGPTDEVIGAYTRFAEAEASDTGRSR